MPDVQTPEWVKDAVFYQIFPDRFARSESVPKPSGLQPWGAPPTPQGYQGGDLLGVLEHLDYLADPRPGQPGTKAAGQGLGITAIYFNPIFRAASNHRYHTHDYYQVDPMLGGNAALRRLLDAAHRRGIRVILDGVFNHASRGFFQFHDILENGPESAYLDWFTVEDWPLRPYGSRQPNYRCWWNLPALPKFNTDTPAVREFIWDVARYWIEFGIDGWRLDVPTEIDDDHFWRGFRRAVKGVNPEAYIVGEVWDWADRWLQGDQFDAVMNYGVARTALGFFAGETFDRAYRPGGFKLRPLRGKAFSKAVDRMMRRYPTPITQAQFNLLDSHDTARFIHQAQGDRSALKLALLFLMTIPGAPCIYYGTEIGMAGGPDPDCRRAFSWDQATWDSELLAYTKHVIALRHAHPALRRGDFETLFGSGDLYAFGRRFEDDAIVVVFNAGRTAARLTLDVAALLREGMAPEILTGESAGRVFRRKLRDVKLPPRSAAIFSRS